VDEIQKINSSFSVDQLEIEINDNNQDFTIKSVLRGDPSITFTYQQRELLEKKPFFQNWSKSQFRY